MQIKGPIITLLLSLFFAFLFIAISFGQDSKTIKVYFKYGSKPAHHFRKTEKRYFGGIHGGHVSIGIDTAVVGFSRYQGFHIFAHKKNFKSQYHFEGISSFLKDTSGRKYSTFEIQLPDSQYCKLKTVINNYLFVKTPYDYAFFGMRCASATYDVLSQVGLFKKKSRSGNIISNFYPKLLRKKMFKLAKQQNYKITKQPGRPSRKWEKD